MRSRPHLEVSCPQVSVHARNVNPIGQTATWMGGRGVRLFGASVFSKGETLDVQGAYTGITSATTASSGVLVGDGGAI